MNRRVLLAIGATSLAILACTGSTSTPATTQSTELPTPTAAGITAAPPATPSPSPAPPSSLTSDEAVGLARGHPQVPDDAPLISARLERWGVDTYHTELSPTPEPARQVWVINMGFDSPSPTGGEGWLVVLDSETGEVLSFSSWMS